MRWPFKPRRGINALTNVGTSIADPAVAALLFPGGLVDLAGVQVGESSVLGLSAFYRASALVSGTVASLPLVSYTTGPDGRPRQVPSVFDDPDGPDGQTAFEWKESLLLHLLLHGRAGAIKGRSAAGSVARLALVHPLAFAPRLPTIAEFQSGGKLPAGGLWFDVRLADGTQVTMDGDSFWYVPAASLANQLGISVMQYGRASLSTSIAGDRAAAKVFSRGALLSGLATPADDGALGDDLDAIRNEINRSVLGYENAGTIALINRRLQFTPWTMTAQQAQFIESRQFQIEEISRWTGVPPHLLMQTDKQTSWGTGVDEQNRGLSKFVLGHWAQRIEQRASRLLARPRWAMFDFASLERPNVQVETEIDLSQVAQGVMTVDEYRAKRGWPKLIEPAPAPVPGGGNDDPAAG